MNVHPLSTEISTKRLFSSFFVNPNALHNKQAELNQLKADNKQLKEELLKVYEDIKLSPLCYRCAEEECLRKEINQLKAEKEELEKWKKEHLKDVEFIERNSVVKLKEG